MSLGSCGDLKRKFCKMLVRKRKSSILARPSPKQYRFPEDTEWEGPFSEEAFIKKLINKGVITIPINPEMEALNIAEVTFPFAMETMTTEEETVEGNAAKK